MPNKTNPGRACQRAGAEKYADAAACSPSDDRQQAVICLSIEVIAGPPDTWRVEVDGELLLARARVPLLEGARALVARGVDPETRITMKRPSGPECFIPVRLGFAARWTISEPDGRSVHLRRWRPGPEARL